MTKKIGVIAGVLISIVFAVLLFLAGKSIDYSVQEKYFEKDKLHLLKTHNSLIPYNGNSFTTKKQTLGAIYIIRDPRSVIISSAHHYSLNYETALEYMTDPQKSLLVKSADGDFANFTYLSSWSNHYKSWIKNSDFKILFIKYEDLEDNKYEIFRDIIIFIETLTKRNIKGIETVADISFFVRRPPFTLEQYPTPFD